MDFNLRVSNIKIGGKKSVEQFSALKIIMNLYNPQDYVLQFFKDYSMIMNNVRYDLLSSGLGSSSLNLDWQQV